MLINYHGESKVIKKICDILNGFKVSDISDVELTSLSDGEVLKYDSATDKWVNGTGGGGGSSTLAGLTDVNVSGVADGDYLAYNSSTSKWEDITPPTINNATLNIKAGDVSKGTFTANASSDVNIVVMPFSITENANGGYDVTYPS